MILRFSISSSSRFHHPGFIMAIVISSSKSLSQKASRKLQSCRVVPEEISTKGRRACNWHSKHSCLTLQLSMHMFLEVGGQQQEPKGSTSKSSFVYSTTPLDLFSLLLSLVLEATLSSQQSRPWCLQHIPCQYVDHVMSRNGWFPNCSCGMPMHAYRTLLLFLFEVVEKILNIFIFIFKKSCTVQLPLPHFLKLNLQSILK